MHTQTTRLKRARSSFFAKDDCSSLDSAAFYCRSHRFQKQLREEIRQDRDSEKNQANFEQRLQVNVSRRLGKLVRDDARKGVAGSEQRSANLRRVPDHHRHCHGFTQGATESENDRAEKPFL